MGVVELDRSAVSAGPAEAASGPRYRSLLTRAGITLGSAALVLWVAATITFFAMRLLAPADPVALVLGPTATPTEAQHDALMIQYGFDRPLVVQYLGYIGGMFIGDFGTSFLYKQPVAQVIGTYLGSTLILLLTALVTAWVIAVTWTVATTGRSRRLGAVGAGAEIIAISIPQLWLSILLLVVFAFSLGWFPLAGSDGMITLVLPTMALAVPLAGYLGLATRDAFETALEQPFVVSSLARGSTDLRVRLRHVLRHAALPGITVTGFAVGWLLSGAVVVESVFGRQGLGSVLLKAVLGQDVPLVGGIVLISAAFYIAANAAVDLLYPIIDPRIRAA